MQSASRKLDESPWSWALCGRTVTELGTTVHAPLKLHVRSGLRVAKCLQGFQQYDFLLGSDLVYDAEMVGPLVNVVATLLKRTGAFYYVHRLRRQGADLFIDA